MAFCFLLGKADPDAGRVLAAWTAKYPDGESPDDDPYPDLDIVIQPPNDPTVHADPMEATPFEGAAHRLPSYGMWAFTLDNCPELSGWWRWLEAWFMDNPNNGWVPVRAYEPFLAAIEREAEADIAAGGEFGHRGAWLVDWSRECLRRYDHLAAFLRPGEL